MAGASQRWGDLWRSLAGDDVGFECSVWFHASRQQAERETRKSGPWPDKRKLINSFERMDFVLLY